MELYEVKVNPETQARNLNEQYIKQQINNCSAIIFKISLNKDPTEVPRDGALRSKGQSSALKISLLHS